MKPGVVLAAAVLLSTMSHGTQDPTVEWPFYGGDQAGTKYSSLAEITRDNVRDLEVAWEWKTGDAARKEFGKRTAVSYPPAESAGAPLPRSSVTTRSKNPARRKTGAIVSRAATSMAASGIATRRARIAGSAITASPSQLGAMSRMRPFTAGSTHPGVIGCQTR